MTIKDWTTTTIAVLAFSISASTAYFNVLLQTDELRVGITLDDIAVMDWEASELVLLGSTLIFINTGNRSALVMNPIMSVNTQNGLCGENKFGIGLDAFVVQQKEITCKRYRLSPMDQHGEPRPSDDSKRVSLPVVKADNVKASVCLHTIVTTPSHAKLAVVRLVEFEFRRPNTWAVTNEKIFLPKTLVSRRGSIFSDVSLDVDWAKFPFH